MQREMCIISYVWMRQLSVSFVLILRFLLSKKCGFNFFFSDGFSFGFLFRKVKCFAENLFRGELKFFILCKLKELSFDRIGQLFESIGSLKF